MDTAMPDRNNGDGGGTSILDQEPSVASVAPPPSSSALSDAPESDLKESDSGSNIVVGPSSTVPRTEGTATNGENLKEQQQMQPGLIGSGTVNAEEAAGNGAPVEMTAQNQHISNPMATPVQFATPTTPAVRGAPRGRPRGRPGRPRGGYRSNLDRIGTTITSNGTEIKIEGDGSQPAPGSGGRPRGVGRGRGGGRPRGSRARGSGRGGKRKRNNDDDENDISDLTDSSDEVTPVATMTKSGRNVQKPTSFVPPPPSPSTAGPAKRKRPYTHRNPQAAVCKVCLRGTSPTSNPVVFCDGCNAPYHRWCHKPPIEQAVIDEADKEWYCQICEEERVVPVPEAEVAQFVGVPGDASEEQRRKYFSSLPQGVLVTLLVKASNMRPELPLFAPDWKPSAKVANENNGNEMRPPPPPPPRFNGLPARKIQPAADDAAYIPGVHPENYVRPGHGLMSTLPPDQADLEFLVDDDDKYGVFTHLYQTPQVPVNQPVQAAPATANTPPVSAAHGQPTAR